MEYVSIPFLAVILIRKRLCTINRDHRVKLMHAGLGERMHIVTPLHCSLFVWFVGYSSFSGLGMAATLCLYSA